VNGTKDGLTMRETLRGASSATIGLEIRLRFSNLISFRGSDDPAPVTAGSSLTVAESSEEVKDAASNEAEAEAEVTAE